MHDTTTKHTRGSNLINHRPHTYYMSRSLYAITDACRAPLYVTHPARTVPTIGLRPAGGSPSWFGIRGLVTRTNNASSHHMKPPVSVEYQPPRYHKTEMGPDLVD